MVVLDRSLQTSVVIKGKSLLKVILEMDFKFRFTIFVGATLFSVLNQIGMQYFITSTSEVLHSYMVQLESLIWHPLYVSF